MLARAAAWRYPRSVPNGSHAVGFDLLPLLYTALLFASALFVPALISRFVSPRRPPGPGPGPGAGEDDGGGGPPPPIPPKPPRGGLPLEVSRPARIRLRDARRLAQRLPARTRRAAREPVRSPARHR